MRWVGSYYSVADRMKSRIRIRIRIKISDLLHEGLVWSRFYTVRKIQLLSEANCKAPAKNRIYLPRRQFLVKILNF